MRDFEIEFEQTKLKDFVKDLKEGDGFEHTLLPETIGKELEKLLGNFLEKPVVCVVIRKKWNSFHARKFKYHCSWELCTDIEIPPCKIENFSIFSDADEIFKTRYKAEMRKTKTGYEIYAEY